MIIHEAEQEEQKVIKSLSILNTHSFLLLFNFFLYVYIYAGGNCQACWEEEEFTKSEFCHYK